MFLIANVGASFYKELLLTAQNAQVWVRTKEIGTKSFVLEYAVVSTKNDELVLHASGTTTQVMFDMKTRTTFEIEDWVRNGLTDFK